MRLAAAVATAATLALNALTTAPAIADDVTLTTTDLGCRTYFDETGVGTNAAAYADSLTLTQSPADPDAGETVTVTLTAEDGPIDKRDGARIGTVKMLADVVVAGSTAVIVSLSSRARFPESTVERGERLGAYELTGTYVASGDGPQSLSLQRLRFDDTSRGDADVVCSRSGDRDHRRAPEATDLRLDFEVTGPQVSVTSVAGQLDDITTHARRGDLVRVDLSRFPPRVEAGAITAELCDAYTQSCSPAVPTELVTDDRGAGQGEVRLPTDVEAGVLQLRVATEDSEARTLLNVLGEPQVTLFPASGVPGTTIRVIGSNFDPGTSVTFTGWDGAAGAATTDGVVRADVTPQGTFQATYAIRPLGTTAVVVEGGQADPAAVRRPPVLPTYVVLPTACSSAPSCTTRQQIELEVRGGPLTSLVRRPLIRVVDIRGVQTGWTMSASTSPRASRDLGPRVRLSPRCRDVSEGGTSAPGLVAGPSEQTLRQAATLCVKDDQLGGGDSTGGLWEVDAPAKARDSTTITILLA